MASVNARRIARLEQGRAAVFVNVIVVATGETDDEAFARHRGIGPCIVCPSRATDDELADLEPMWAEQQRRLIADARDETKLKEGNDNGNHARNYASRDTRKRRILSASSVADATRASAWKPG